jgi:DNA polymerase-3 subunit epsilon
MSEKYTFLDFETTGFKNPAPVSLAIIRQENGEVVFSKYFLINPEQPIEYGAYKVHGIAYEDVKDKPNFAQIWPIIQPYIEGQICVGHNVQFDAERVLVKQLQRYGITYKPFTTICTRDNAKKVISKSEIANYKLDTVCEYLDIDFTDHHNAMADTEACRQIFNKIKTMNEMDTKEIV